MFSPNLSDAISALHRYNRREVINVDQRAKQVFGNGLNGDLDDIKRKLEFLLYSYGGVSGRVPNGLVDEVATSVRDNRIEWVEFLSEAPVFSIGQPFEFMTPSDQMFAAFSPLADVDSAADTRCLSKFLHLLEPSSVAIVDRWVAHALDVEIVPGMAKENYKQFASELVKFGMRMTPLLPAVRAIDEGRSWSDSKLLDKILLCRRTMSMSMAA